MWLIDKWNKKKQALKNIKMQEISKVKDPTETG